MWNVKGNNLSTCTTMRTFFHFKKKSSAYLNCELMNFGYHLLLNSQTCCVLKYSGKSVKGLSEKNVPQILSLLDRLRDNLRSRDHLSTSAARTAATTAAAATVQQSQQFPTTPHTAASDDDTQHIRATSTHPTSAAKCRHRAFFRSSKDLHSATDTSTSSTSANISSISQQCHIRTRHEHEQSPICFQLWSRW